MRSDSESPGRSIVASLRSQIGHSSGMVFLPLQRPPMFTTNGSNWDFRFGHPGTVSVLQSAARMHGLRSPLTIDAPFAAVSVAECRSIAAFQLAGGLYADTAPSSSLFSNPASLVRRSPSPVTRLAQAAPKALRSQSARSGSCQREPVYCGDCERSRTSQRIAPNDHVTQPFVGQSPQFPYLNSTVESASNLRQLLHSMSRLEIFLE